MTPPAPELDGSPDPVTDPSAYQRLLIGLVGADDPADVQAPESYELTFTLTAGHDRFHLAQAERALRRVRSGR